MRLTVAGPRSGVTAKDNQLLAMCILLVEDEALIRLIFSEELVEAGFKVCEASSGDHAAKLIEERPEDFTILVTDVHMPGRRNGPDVAHLIRSRHPGIPVIYMTGRPDILSGLGVLTATDIVLAKPFMPSALIAAVRTLLPEPEQPGD